jgi:DNA modification methylase
MYVEHLVEVFRGVKRVLRKDGVCFLNIGDSYSATRWSDKEGTGAWASARIRAANPVIERGFGLPAKNLCLMPSRVALALQADGWWVRSWITLCKKNPMPESVRDRPTSASEALLMLTKSSRYWYDQEAVREAVSDASIERYKQPMAAGKNQALREAGIRTRRPGMWDSEPLSHGRILRDWWPMTTHPMGYELCRACKRVYTQAEFGRLEQRQVDGGRVKRICRCGADDWLSHFATFSPELPKKCILAACPARVCAKCGAGWVRVIDKQPTSMNIRVRDAKRGVATAEEGYGASEGEIEGYGAERIGETRTLGWRPSCSCGCEETEAGIVIDPFIGSGTTAVVAQQLGRRWAGCDLSEDYRILAEARLRLETGKLVMELEG